MNEPTVYTVHTVRYGMLHVMYERIYAKLSYFFPCTSGQASALVFFILNLTCNFATDAVFTY